MAYDRAWLRTETRNFLHDQQIDATKLDTFIDLGALRIGQKLRSYANQVTTDFQLNNTLSDLPADLVTLRTIRYPSSDGRMYALQSTSSHWIEGFQDRSGGQPAYYQLRGVKIAVRPFVQGLYELTYWANTAIGTDDADTSDALTAYPFLFLDAALEAGYQYKQDEQQRLAHQSQWLGELHEINKTSARRDAGDVPAQRAI